MGVVAFPHGRVYSMLTEVPDIRMAFQHDLGGRGEVVSQQDAQKLIDHQDRFGQIVHRLPFPLPLSSPG